MKNLNVGHSSNNWIEVHFDKAQIDKKNLTAFMKVDYNIDGVSGTKYIAIENIPPGNEKALKEAKRKLGSMLEKSLNAYISKHKDIGEINYKVINANGESLIDKNLKGKLSARIKSILPGNINKLTKDISLMFKTSGYTFGKTPPWNATQPNVKQAGISPKSKAPNMKAKPTPALAKPVSEQRVSSAQSSRPISTAKSKEPMRQASVASSSPKIESKRESKPADSFHRSSKRESQPLEDNVQSESNGERISSRKSEKREEPQRNIPSEKRHSEPLKESKALEGRQAKSDRPISMKKERASFERQESIHLDEGENFSYDERTERISQRSLDHLLNIQEQVEGIYKETFLNPPNIKLHEHSVIYEEAPDTTIEDLAVPVLSETEVPYDYRQEVDELLDTLPVDEQNLIIDLQTKYNIADENILKMYDSRYVKDSDRERFLNTLQDIVQSGESKHFYAPKKKDTFGWSVTEGFLFIRMNFKGEGAYMKASSVLCLNDMKEYINLSPRKGEVLEQSGEVDRKKKKKFSPLQFQTGNFVKEREAQRKKELHDLGIPNIVPMHLVSYTSKTKRVGPKTSYIVEKSEDLFNAKVKPRLNAYEVDQEPLEGLPLEEFDQIILTSFDTLRHLHYHNRSHNDLKPNNFMMNPNGGVYLADFDGLTRTDLQERVEISTPMYWSPEFYEKSSDDLIGTTQNDAYAMGVIYLELLLGSPHPVDIFLDNNEEIATKWQNYFLEEDIAKIDALPISDEERQEIYDEITVAYNTRQYNADLGNRLGDPNRFAEFIVDLDKELEDRGNLTPEQKMIALGIISGLLDPDPDNRMSMQEAYQQHLNFIDIS